MSKPRVLLLIRHLDAGGAERCVLNLACALSKLNCEPHVYGWRSSGILEPHFRHAGIVPEYPARPPKGLSRIKVPGNIAAAIGRHRIDIVHAHMSDCAVWGTLAQRLTGCPCVITHHTNDLIDTVGSGRPLYGWMRRRLLFRSARRAATNIAVSAPVARRLARAASLPAKSMTIVPNGVAVPPNGLVNRSRIARAKRAKDWATTPVGPRIVFVGRLVQVKGLNSLIAAIPRVLESFPGAIVELVGDGEERDALGAQASALGVSEHVRFAGYASDVTPWLENADLMASPSLLEGLPLAVLEAMAWGLPVVTSDIDGHREIVRSGDTGALFATNSPDEAAQAIVAALMNWRETEAKALRGRDLVKAGYSIDAMAARHLELYRAILEARSVHAGR